MFKLNSLKAIKTLPGTVGFYYKDLVSGSSTAFNSDEPVIAASVIKLPIMAVFFDEAEHGRLNPQAKVTPNAAHKYPSCGVES